MAVYHSNISGIPEVTYSGIPAVTYIPEVTYSGISAVTYICQFAFKEAGTDGRRYIASIFSVIRFIIRFFG
jgi:hypothetical protein